MILELEVLYLCLIATYGAWLKRKQLKREGKL